MSTRTDSFDASRHGARVASQHGDAFNVGGRKILLWDADWPNDIYYNAQNITPLRNFYASSHRVDFSSGYSGVLADYSLIFHIVATREPEWMSVIRSGDWSGRIHLTAEHLQYPPAFQAIPYIDSLANLHGMNVTGANPQLQGWVSSPTSPHPLTEGVPSIRHNDTSFVGGGSALSYERTQFRTWLAENTVGDVSWVIAGDGNHLTDFTNTRFLVDQNAQFLRNLYEVPV